MDRGQMTAVPVPGLLKWLFLTNLLRGNGLCVRRFPGWLSVGAVITVRSKTPLKRLRR